MSIGRELRDANIRLSKFIVDNDLDLPDREQERLDKELRQYHEHILRIDPDAASIDEMRELLKMLLAERRVQNKESRGPLGIDNESSLPVHFELPECPLCRTRVGTAKNDLGELRTRCHDCAGPIEYHHEFGGHGLESETIDHLHLHNISGGGGRQIRIPVRRELCHPCYRIDHAKAHPDRICMV